MKDIFIGMLLICFSATLTAQQQTFVKSFEHFEESRGNAALGQILTLPYKETVTITRALNSRSGLGPKFNYYGTVVAVDQWNRTNSGKIQLVLRREDGRDFYGFRPTIKAILSTTSIANTGKKKKE